MCAQPILYNGVLSRSKIVRHVCLCKAYIEFATALPELVAVTLSRSMVTVKGGHQSRRRVGLI